MFQKLWIISEQNKDLCLHRACVLVFVRNSVQTFLVKFVSIKCFTLVLVLLNCKIKPIHLTLKENTYMSMCIGTGEKLGV